MTDKTYRQGEGAVHHFTGEGPTARKDGVPLAQNEVAGFNLYITDDAGAVEVVNNVQLQDTTDDGVWNGTFTVPVDVDSITSGVYIYHMTTMGTGGKESDPSNTVRLEILPPLAPPNPPVLTG